MNKVKEIFDYYFNIICTLLLIFLISGVCYLIYTSFTKKEKSIVDNSKIALLNENNDIHEESSKIKVDIKGAIKKQGVYEISNNSNVSDLIKLAGGLAKNATTDNINLSRHLEDQMVIKIFTKKELAKKNNKDVSECVCSNVVINECENSSVIKQTGDNINVINDNNTTTQATNSLISINTASREQLMTLTSIGESKANAIISYRQENGPFKTIDDIKNVSGIGDALFEKIKSSITV